MSTKIRFMNFVAFLLKNVARISLAYDHIAKLFFVKHRLFLMKLDHYWIDSNVWNARFLAAMILSGSAVHLNGLASLSLYSAMKRLIAA